MSPSTVPSWSSEGATHEFAAFISATRFEDLPQEVVQGVKHAILDTVAVTVAGATEPAARTLAALMRTYGGTPLATVIGLPMRTDPATAALLNGTSGHVLDYDDYCFAMSGHPSVTILPGLLALAEQHHLSGRDVIRAYAVGFEAAIMASHVINPAQYNHGWHGTGTVGAIGASSAAANLLGLDLEQTMDAISFGVSAAAGNRQNFGTDIKPYHAGNAARAGVLAAELARTGFGGNHQILEGRYGFFHLFTPGHGEHPKPDRGFGDPWSVLSPGITTKVFPSCGSTHSGIGGILELRAEGLQAEDIAHIEVALTDVAAGNCQYPRPRTGLEAKFSLQYCLARALTAGWVGMDDFSDAAVRDRSLEDLMARIDFHHDPALTEAYAWGDPRPSVMTIDLRSGEQRTHRAATPPGSPGNLTHEMLLEKYRDCMARGAVVGDVDAIARAVEHLDEVGDVGALLAAMAGR